MSKNNPCIIVIGEKDTVTCPNCTKEGMKPILDKVCGRCIYLKDLKKIEQEQSN